MAWLPREFQNFRIASTPEAETSVSGNAECLLVIGVGSKLSEVTFSLKKRVSYVLRAIQAAR